jgi:hypothetical protein
LGLFERLLTDGLAFGPQSSELGHVLLKGAVDALLIESQKLEVFALGEPGLSFGEGFVNGNLSGVFSDSPAGVAKLTEYAGSEDASFDGAGALEAPVVFGDGLGKFEFEPAGRSTKYVFRC